MRYDIVQPTDLGRDIPATLHLTGLDDADDPRLFSVYGEAMRATLVGVARGARGTGWAEDEVQPETRAQRGLSVTGVP